MKFKKQKFAKCIKAKMESKEMTVRTAAEQTDVSIGTINKLMHEKIETPDLITYARLCRWMSVPLENFI